jgi:hypothetical protein
MSTTIPWIQYTEAVVAQGHPTLADVTNRPLSTVMQQSGYGLTDTFYGFASGILNPGSPVGAFSAPVGFVYQQSDAASPNYPLWVKLTGAGPTGWQALNDFTGYPVTTQNLNVLGNAAINGTTHGVGAVTFDSTLSVGGLASLNLGLTVIGGNTSVTTLSSSGLATLNSLSVTNGATFNGLVTFNNSIHGSLTPDANATYNIGSVAFRWNTIRGMTFIAGTDNGGAVSIRTQTGLSSTYGTDLGTQVFGESQNLSALAGSAATSTLVGSSISIITGTSSKQVVVVGNGALAGYGDIVIGQGAGDTSDGTITGFAGERGITIGLSSYSHNYRGVHIGYALNNAFASSGRFSYQNVIIGSQIQIGNQNDRHLTVVGDSSSISGWTGGGSGTSKLTIIGGQNTLTGSLGATIVLGGNNTLTTGNQIVIGVGNVAANLTQANALYIGGPDLSVSNVIVGAGDTVVSPSVLTFRGTNASGIDNAAGDLLIQSGLSTGAGTPSRIRLRVAVAGVSGSVLQTASDMLIISGTGFSFGSNLTPTVDNSYSLGTSALRWTTGNFSSYVAIGTNPAASGAVRLANSSAVTSRNAANTTDIPLVQVDISNNAVIGGANTVAINFNAGNLSTFQVATTGHFLNRTDNIYDIGASGATRPRSLYVGTSAVIGTDPGGSGILRVGADNTNGSFRFGGIGSIGVAVNTAQLLTVWGAVPHPSAAINIVGIAANYITPSTATASSYTLEVGATTIAAAFAAGQVGSIYIVSPVIGAGSSVTSFFGHRIDNQGNAAITTSYGLFLAAQSGSTNTYAIYSAGGSSYHAGNFAILGNPGATNIDQLLYIGYSGTAHPSTSAAIYGFRTDFTIPTTATNQANQFAARSRLAVGGTYNAVIGFDALSPVASAGSTVVSMVGFWAQNQGMAGVTNSYGLLIDPQSGSTNNYAIKTGTGLVQFGDVVRPDTDNTRDLGVLTTNRWRDIFAARLRLIDTTASSTMGQVTLVGGTKVVSTTAVTANSRIFLTSDAPGGTIGFLSVSARVAGTSFTIQSSNALDTSNVSWIIVEPA